ncbi:MAG: phospholipase D-like domain-containing protein [Prevotella sp.]|nr:phospholipase D-like domain-containing protein [Prevotella sp.]
MSVEFIAGKDHYDKVIERVASVKKSLWIGTADIKDLYVKAGNRAIPFLGVLANLLRRGVEIRLIHAKEPGPAFREDFDRYPILKTGLERMLCPRVHFKIVIFDFETAYIGSANLTGAGIGMKSSNRRNFEAGILTNEPSLVEAAAEQFDSVWRGAHCPHCGRRQYCAEPINII